MLVVTDLHERDGNFPARISYRDEIDHVYRHLKATIEKYREGGYSVGLLFLGDIFHKSYKVPDNMLENRNKVAGFIDMVDFAYTAVGNHEITYAKNNPFWHMVDSLHMAPSLNAGWHKKSLIAKGYREKLKVADRVVLGNTEILFNHHGIPWHKPSKPEDGMVTIGLFHQDVMVTELLKVMEEEYDHSIFDYGFDYMDGTSRLAGYDIAFVGHNHLTYGKYVYEQTSGEKTIIQWLASLGRSNVREVSNTFLERDIPAIIVEDKEFKKVESNKFQLLTREVCVNEAQIEKDQESRRKVKERKRMGTMTFYDDPYQNLLDTFAEKPDVLDILEASKERSLSVRSLDLDEKLHGVLGGYWNE